MSIKFKSYTELQNLLDENRRQLILANEKNDEVYEFLSHFSCFMQNIFELGQVAQRLFSLNKIEYEDSQEMFATCMQLAIRFEEDINTRFYHGEDVDYFGEMESFAERELIKEFGIPNKPEPRKDIALYEKDYHAVCYVPDQADCEEDQYSHSRLLALVQGNEALCYVMFCHLDGQFPEVWLENRICQKLWGKCAECGRVYESSSIKPAECPHCHSLIPGDEDPMTVCLKTIEEEKAKGE